MTGLPKAIRKESPYLTWAKVQRSIELDLAGSGVPPCTRDELGPAEMDAPLTERNDYGWPPLVARLAQRYRVAEASVVVAAGASMANHLAMATLLAPGDHVLVESPIYDPLALVPPLWGARVEFFTRAALSAYRLDVDAVRDRLTGRTRLVVISNLHNPSGALASDADLSALAELGDRFGFHVLVDEVYREWLHGGHTTDGREAGLTLSSRIVVTSSMTKAFGLNGLRIGWVLAEPELARRMRRFAGLFDNIVAHPSERLAAQALDRAHAILDPRRQMVTDNRHLLRTWLQATPAVRWTEPAAGTVAWLDLGIGDTTDFTERLVREHRTAIVPGHFFRDPTHVRVALGVNPETLSRGLERLSLALGTAR